MEALKLSLGTQKMDSAKSQKNVTHKKFIFTILFVLCFFKFSIAQNDDDESLSSPKKKELADKFFMAISTSTYTDIIISPLRYYYAPTGNTDSAGNYKYANIPFQSQQFNIISLGFEPRLNLKEFDENSSMSISIPLSFGIGSSYSAAGSDLVVRGVDGFGSFQAPLLVKLNFGNGSTYTTQKDFGFSAGAGVEFNKIGIINLTPQSKEFNKAFLLPSLSAGFTFMRGDSPMEVNFKYSFGRVKFQEKDTQDGILKDEIGIPYIRNTRGQTIKLSFVYLMNY